MEIETIIVVIVFVAGPGIYYMIKGLFTIPDRTDEVKPMYVKRDWDDR